MLIFSNYSTKTHFFLLTRLVEQPHDKVWDQRGGKKTTNKLITHFDDTTSPKSSHTNLAIQGVPPLIPDHTYWMALFFYNEFGIFFSWAGWFRAPNARPEFCKRRWWLNFASSEWWIIKFQKCGNNSFVWSPLPDQQARPSPLPHQRSCSKHEWGALIYCPLVCKT